MRRNVLAPVLAVAAGAIVLVVVLVVVSNLGSGKKSVNTSNLKMVSSLNAMLGGISQKGTALGNPKAKLTLIEFGDLQCLGCAFFSENVVPELIQNYVRSGNLRIEFEGQTIIDHSHQDSARLLRMALAAAQQNKLWNFVEIVYANQGAEDSGYATDSYLKAIAASVQGLSADKAFSVSQANTFAAAIAKSKARFDAEHFDGTPSFLLGRTGAKTMQKITGLNVPSYAELATLLNTQLRS